MALGAAWLAGVSWFMKRTIAQVDGKAEKTDVKALIDEIRAERESAKESRGRLYDRVNNIGESLARLEGRLGK